jgi:hypothetical protein
MLKVSGLRLSGECLMFLLMWFPFETKISCTNFTGESQESRLFSRTMQTLGIIGD